MNDEEEKVALIYNIKLPYLFQKKLKDGLGQEIGDIFEEALIETVGDAKDVWRVRAIVLFRNIIDILVFYRDSERKEITLSAIKSYLDINKISCLYKDEKIPENISLKLKEYMKAIPFYNTNAKKQVDVAEHYYDFIQMIIEQVLDRRFGDYLVLK